jgi:hypothetical protein
MQANGLAAEYPEQDFDDLLVVVSDACFGGGITIFFFQVFCQPGLIEQERIGFFECLFLYFQHPAQPVGEVAVPA